MSKEFLESDLERNYRNAIFIKFYIFADKQPQKLFMYTITLNEFFTHFKRYVVTILNGDRIVIYNGKPPSQKKDKNKASRKRPLGLCQGEFVVPDNFNEPLPDDVVSSFYQQ